MEPVKAGGLSMDNSSRPDSDRTIDRRSVLKAGAWATPVVVAAVAVPLAAATTIQEGGDAIIITSFGVEGGQDWNNPYLNVHFDYYYQYYNFQSARWPGSPASVPASLTTVFTVKVIDTVTGQLIVTDEQTKVLAQNASFAYSQHLPSSAPFLLRGRSYRVELTVKTMPASVGPTTFQATSPLARVDTRTA